MGKRSHYVKAIKEALGVRKVLCRGKHGFSVTIHDSPGTGLRIYWFDDGEPVEQVVKSVRAEWEDSVNNYCGYPSRHEYETAHKYLRC